MGDIDDIQFIRSNGLGPGGPAGSLPSQGMSTPISMTNSFAPGQMGAALIGGVGGVISAAMSAGASKEINEQNIAYAREATGVNQAFAREQMAFQERMSNSAYQRATDDMRKAGLNPMLAFSQGGASAPSGSSGQAVTPDLEKVDNGEIVRRSLASAMELAAFEKEMESKDSAIKLNNAAEAAKQTEVKLNEASAKNVETNTKVTRARMPAIRAEATKDEGQAKWDTKLQGIDNVSRRLWEQIGNAGGAMRDFGKSLFSPKNPTTPRPGQRNYGQGYKDGFLKAKGKKP